MNCRYAVVLLLILAGGCAHEATSPPEASNATDAPAAESRDTEFVGTDPEPSRTVPLAGPERSPAAESDPETPLDLQLSQLFQAVQQLQSRLDQIQEDHQRLLAVLGTSASSPQDPARITSLANRLDQLQDAVSRLTGRSDQLQQSIDEEVVALRPPAPSHGRLTVENNTERDQEVWINGTAHRIWAGSQVIVDVPIGEVTTKAGDEEPRTWQIDAPDYAERIELVPASLPTPGD